MLIFAAHRRKRNIHKKCGGMDWLHHHSCSIQKVLHDTDKLNSILPGSIYGMARKCRVKNIVWIKNMGLEFFQETVQIIHGVYYQPVGRPSSKHCPQIRLNFLSGLFFALMIYLLFYMTTFLDIIGEMLSRLCELRQLGSLNGIKYISSTVRDCLRKCSRRCFWIALLFWKATRREPLQSYCISKLDLCRQHHHC